MRSLRKLFSVPLGAYRIAFVLPDWPTYSLVPGHVHYGDGAEHKDEKNGVKNIHVTLSHQDLFQERLAFALRGCFELVLAMVGAHCAPSVPAVAADGADSAKRAYRAAARSPDSDARYQRSESLICVSGWRSLAGRCGFDPAIRFDRFYSARRLRSDIPWRRYREVTNAETAETAGSVC